MLQVEAKFGTDLQLIKYIDIRGIRESFKEIQTEQNSDQLLWLCKALGTAWLVLQLKYLFPSEKPEFLLFSHKKGGNLATLSEFKFLYLSSDRMLEFVLNTVELNSQNYEGETNWSGKFSLILLEAKMQLAAMKS